MMEQLRKYMIEKKIGYREVAEKIGYSYQNLYKLFNRKKVPFKSFVDIANALGLTVEVVLCDGTSFDDTPFDSSAQAMLDAATHGSVNLDDFISIIRSMGFAIHLRDKETE